MFMYLDLVPPVVFVDGLEFVFHNEALLRSCKYISLVTYLWNNHSWYSGLLYSSIHDVTTDD
jgi:hypothetical protein